MPLQGDSRNPLTYLLCDLMTGQVLAELPFTGVTFSQRLNTAGTFTGSLNFLDPRVQTMMPGQIIQPGKTALFVDYNGVLLWGGIIWTVNFSRSSAQAVTVSGKEFWSYFASRIQPFDYTTPTWPNFGGAADAMVIATNIVTDTLSNQTTWTSSGPASASLPFPLQAYPLSAMGPTTGFPLTIVQNGGPIPGGDWVSMSYPATSHQTVDSIITNLSAMGYGSGFDFAIDVAYNTSGVPVLTLNLSYPRRGRVATVDEVIVITEQAMDYTYPQDATGTANAVVATGSGSGNVQWGQSPTYAQSAAGWPVLEKLNSHTYINGSAALTAVMQEDLALQQWPITVPTITIPMFGDPQPFAYSVGDDIIWTIESDERFPSGTQAEWRIVGIDFKPVDDGGISTAVLTLNTPPATASQTFEPPT